MAHVGSFVPANEATVGVCDRILTRLRSNESVTSTMSTFSSDSSQIAFMLRNCTPRSMVLIDEYGKGTARNDGIALLAAIIRLFQSWEASGPRVMIATHFHELFTRRLIEKSLYISFSTMSFMQPAKADGSVDSNGRNESGTTDAGELVFLYKLTPGITTNSYGFHCALRAGMDSKFVDRAKAISHAISQSLPVAPLSSLCTPAAKHEKIVKAFRELELPAEGTYPSDAPLPLPLKQRVMQFLSILQSKSVSPTSSDSGSAATSQRRSDLNESLESS
eukprot:gb/GEZN01007815.1/.p1 GENE.gb/GEZN01007815.1/~~gb/GEZN01007815.1/.p1  ORF type:complete len:321 (-),score=22.55 gb/GEZN01007815.1/:536-1366(-)